MKNKELKKMGHQKIIQKLVSCLCDQKWISEDERTELPAIVSHWLQTPSSTVPFLTNSIRNECNRLVDKIDENQSAKGLSNCVCEFHEPYQLNLNFLFNNLPFPPPSIWDFTFIDLFAGIGGIRIAFQEAGGKCIFTSEWDKFAKQTYEANFGEYPYGDIRKINKSEIPDHDVLCAGFPCQPFSIAGVSKKNSLGRKHGFEDETQGTLFFEIKEVLRIKRPKAFMLENVKNLISHDKRKTFEVIRHTLEDQLGYVVNWKIVDGGRWVPQHRERIFIVGYDPKQISIDKHEIIIPEGPGDGYAYPELESIIKKKVKGYTLGPGTWATLERHKAHHAKIGNGFGYGIHKLPIKKGTVTRTISARYHKDGAEILIEQKGDRPRRLTIEEAMQIQGYDPAKFVFPVSNTQAYKQIGNSVVVSAIEATAHEIAKILKDTKRWQ
ncbi:MAG: DNA (cytosine-5-)-methyltransferase [Desulfobacteraceae bacterium]|nr:DNA (cytosine-5-)-methyltransferase [Desulfobacteraceae bacterium]